MAKVRFTHGLDIIGDFEPVYLHVEEDPPEEPDDINTPQNAPEHSAGTLLQDTGIDLAKGVIGVPAAITGLYDIATGGRAGQLLEENGVRFDDALEFLESNRSEPGKRAKQEVADAEGFVDTAAAALSNPSTILSTVAESAPAMLAGGAIGKGVTTLAPKVAPFIGGAAGEGAIAAGGMAEQLRQGSDTGKLTGTQSAIAAGSGVATALLGAAGGKIAKWLGIADPDTLLAGGKLSTEVAEKVQKNLARRLVEGGVSEAVFEELPQSLQEQVLTNLASDKPWDEGLDQAAVMGTLAGGVMGGGAQLLPQQTNLVDDDIEPPTISAEGAAADGGQLFTQTNPDLIEVAPGVFQLKSSPNTNPGNMEPVYEDGELVGWKPEEEPDTPDPNPTPADPARVELATAINARLETGEHVNLTDEELGAMLGNARSLETEAPGSVNIDALNAEVERRASLGTMQRAAETAERELQRDPTAFTSDEELAAQQEAQQAEETATADKQNKEAQKQAEKQAKEAQKQADKQAKEAQKLADKQATEAQKLAEKQANEPPIAPPVFAPGIDEQNADILALEAQQQQEIDDGLDEQVPGVAGGSAETAADLGVGSGAPVQLAAGTGPQGTGGEGRLPDSRGIAAGTGDSAAVESAGGLPDTVDPKAELSAVKRQLAQFVAIDQENGGLNATEGQEYQRLTQRLNQLTFQSAKPATAKQVSPAGKRMSTLSPEANTAAYNDLIRTFDVFEPLMAAASGVHFDANTPVDDVLLGKNPKVTPEQLYSAFDATREALRAQYGDTITLYRATGKQRKKPTTNWATTQKFAKQFGDKITKKTFPVEQVIAAVVNPNGQYHELVIGKPPAGALVPTDLQVEEIAADYAPTRAEGSSATFEVAPDPADTALTERWNKLPHLKKVAISGKIAAEIVPKALTELGIKGEVSEQLGGYLDETNPSFTLRATPDTAPEDLIEAAKLTGFALSQDSVMVVSDKTFAGSDPTGVIKIRFPGTPTPDQVHGVYMKIRQASGGDIMGHSTVKNTMQIMTDLADIDRQYAVVKSVLAKEPGRYTTTIKRDAHWAFIGKEDYENGSDRLGRGKGTVQTGRPVLRGRSDLRAEATRLVQEALDEHERGTAQPATSKADPTSQVATAAVEEPKGSSYGLTKAEVESLPAAQQRARADALDAVDVLRRHPTSVLGSALAKDFKQRGAVSLIGRTIKTTDDLAVAAQVLRDPRFETIRYFFVKGQKVVGQTSVSSRLPASSFAAPEGMDPGRYTLNLAEEAKKVGATGYYLMHNHPSGDPTPSEADRRLTQHIVDTVGDTLEYHGHVIIDHQAYSVLDAQGNGAPIKRKFKKTYDSSTPTKKHALLGASIVSPEQLAHIGKQVAASKDTVIIFGQGNGGIRGIWEVDPTSMSPLRQAATLRRMALSTASPQLFAYNIPDSAIQRAATAIRTGLLTDAISLDGDKPMSIAQFSAGRSFNMALGKRVKTKEVAQDLPEYTPGTAKALDKQAKNKATSKSKQSKPNLSVSGGSPTPAPATTAPAGSPPGQTPGSAAGSAGAGAPPNPLSWNAPTESKVDDLVYSLQDKHIDTKRVMAAIKNVTDKFDVYLQELLFHGRVATRVKHYLSDELKPMLREMAKARVTQEELELYLHNRHAEEANKYIATLEGGLKDGGSGIDTADARAYLAAIPKAKRAALERAAAKVDAMIAKTRQELVSYGLESPATIKAWSDTYKFYVPLHREDMELSHGSGTGQGYSVRGPSTKRRTGSKRNVVDILAHIALQREVAITRGEKNRIALALYGLAVSNPNPDFWEADKPPKQKEVLPGIKTYKITYEGSIVYESDNKRLAQEYASNANLKHGAGSHTLSVTQGPDRIVTSVNPRYKSEPNVIVARLWNPKTGEVEDRTVTFDRHNKRAIRMAEALKNLDANQLGVVVGFISKGTRWFASVNTQYNPVFGALNLMRDLGAAGLNLTSTPLAKHKAQVLTEAAKVLRTLYKELRAERKGQRLGSKYARQWDEFQSMGGKTGYRDMYRNSQERNDQIAAELKSMSEGKIKRGGRAVLDWLTDFNDTAENAVRLAAYMVAKEQGMSKERAAALAKNLTVNFNRKGQVGTQLGAWFAFFNASIQGTARMAETLGGPAGKKILAGGVMVGVAQQLMLAAAGFDDDDPPEFVRERNFIVPLGDKRYLAIPYPLGYNILPNIGRIATQSMLNGFEDPAKSVLQLANVTVDALSPINGGSVGQTLTPTVFDPILALETNKDWTGRSIAREDFNPNKPTPGFSRAKDTSTPHANWASHVFNRLSGGTDYVAGAFSPSPDQIDYLIGQVGGGVLRETNKATQTISSLITGEELPTYKVPFFGRFYGQAKGASHERTVFYSNMDRMHTHELEIKGRIDDKLPVEDYVAEHPEAQLIAYARRTSGIISRLNNRKRTLVQTDAPKADVKQVEDRITELTERFNKRFNELSGDADEQAD